MSTSPPPVTFVGRTAELERLRDALNSTVAEHTGVVVIGGEAGIGKSRLLGELSRMAREVGIPVVVGSCWEIDRTSPLAPVAELLGERSLPLGPADRSSGSPPDPRPDSKAYVIRQKSRLFANLVDQLDDSLGGGSSGEGAPVVVAIEDLHWCDETTLDFIPYLARNSNRPLLLVLTLRPEEADLAVDQCLAELERLRMVTELELGSPLRRGGGRPGPSRARDCCPEG